MESSRLYSLIAIQEAVTATEGDMLSVVGTIVCDRSVMPLADGAVVEFVEGDKLRIVAASGTSEHLIGLELPLQGSLSGQCIQTGQPQRCDDWEADPRVSRAYCRKLGLKSMIVIPIPRKGQTVGVLKYHADRLAAFDDQDMLVARLLAAPISIGLGKIAQADAERIQTQLRDVVRLKEQLVSTVSHELRTPLTSIAGSLSLLNAGAGGDISEHGRSLLAVASRNADRLKKLVNDLLDLDCMDSGRLGVYPERVDLMEVLRELVEAHEPFALGLGVSLVANLSRSVVTVTDPDRLAQIVANLLSNALKFSPSGSPVHLSLDEHRGNARIRVADNGPGIPPDFRPRLFQRFSQSEATRGLSSLPGAGLGLSIARGIAEQLGGSVRLDETVSQGATFEILLPLAPAMA